MGLFFSCLNSNRIAELIGKASGFVCYAAPGVQMGPARAMIEVAARLGPEMISVSVDFDDRVLRMGYGELAAVTLLRDAQVVVNHAPGLRSALLVVDGEGYIFTPTPLYLETEPESDSVRNAMRLSGDQVAEAMARLSVAAKEIALAKARDRVDRERIAAIPLEVGSERVSTENIHRIQRALSVAPPVRFDLARQVRVYKSYIQYIELKLEGASIQRRRIGIPDELQKLGTSEVLEGRLRTTFDLIDNNGELSSKPLEEELNKIRRDFTRSLKGEEGRIYLRSARPLLLERLENLRKQVAIHKELVENKLQEHLAQSKGQIAEHYLLRVMESPPDALLAQCHSREPTREEALRWITSILDRRFPRADALTAQMELSWSFKDVTFETLNSDDLLTSVKAAFPTVDWDRAHEEFTAAAEATDA